MLAISFENGVFGMLAILVIGSLFLIHFLLFRESSRQKKIQLQRLKDFESLVNREIHRSQSLTSEASQLREIKTKTNEKLEVIKLQVEGMKILEKPSKSST